MWQCEEVSWLRIEGNPSMTCLTGKFGKLAWQKFRTLVGRPENVGWRLECWSVGLWTWESSTKVGRKGEDDGNPSGLGNADRDLEQQ